ncbi:E3 ubiquitin-protein ligase LRSAM1-like isoform X2 [Planococcus citri]|uniref:E3 ubiquitin-protein ligase LRSAM1-like isoform X2 n=1 Tax=Planococcus citri TaxID=170843 RepID=UPI0031F7B774
MITSPFLIHCSEMAKALLEKKLYIAKESPEPVFDISDCSLKTVPKGIFAVIKVYRKEFLYLQKNELSSLKEGGNLCDLSLLRVLDLSQNRVSKLPCDIKYLTNLKILKLDQNELNSLPSEIGALSNLEQLSLSSNKLKILPDSISNLKKLQLLDVRKNPNLKTLPPMDGNKCLTKLLLDIENNWKYPPKTVIENGVDAILSFFRKDVENEDVDSINEPIQKEIKVDDILSQLSFHDKYIQEEKVMQTIIAEKTLFEQKEQELLLHKQNQNRKEEFLKNVMTEQHKIDEKVRKFQVQKEMDQNQFIVQLLQVENTANEVINQLLEMNASFSEKCVQTLASSLLNEPPMKEPLRCQQILESMEKLLIQESLIDKKVQEYNLAKNCLIEDSSLGRKEMNDKIENLLSTRKNDQERLLNDIKEDVDLQYAAVLTLIEKVDDRNVELRNEISLVENQLSNLTVMELKNKELHLNKHIDELSEKRLVLSEILMNLFAQQQAYREKLIEQMKEAEKERAFKNDNTYWLMQYQRLLNYIPNNVSRMYSVHPDLVYELTLFGVSHCIPFLSMFDTKFGSDCSQINDQSLEKVGIHSTEDRESILKAISRFTEQLRSNVAPTAPLRVDEEKSLPPSYSNISNNAASSPSAPPIYETVNPTDVGSQRSVLTNECIICMENQSNTILLNCGHICCCENCSAQVNICPLCRCDIERKLRIFTS